MALATPTSRVILDAPFADKDRVKALGARWDPQARRWYVPDGIDPQRFAEWLPKPMTELPSGATLTAGVVFLPQRCYRCGTVTTCVAGVLTDPDLGGDEDGFVPFGAIAGYLTQLLSSDVLTRLGVGPIRRRSSSVRPEGYIANGCRGCDTIMGEFYLEEALLEFLAEGGDYPDLVYSTVELPVGCLDSLIEDDDDDRCHS